MDISVHEVKDTLKVRIDLFLSSFAVFEDNSSEKHSPNTIECHLNPTRENLASAKHLWNEIISSVENKLDEGAIRIAELRRKERLEGYREDSDKIGRLVEIKEVIKKHEEKEKKKKKKS